VQSQQQKVQEPRQRLLQRDSHRGGRESVGVKALTPTRSEIPLHVRERIGQGVCLCPSRYPGRPAGGWGVGEKGRHVRTLDAWFTGERRWVVQADVRMITHIGRHGSVNRQLLSQRVASADTSRRVTRGQQQACTRGTCGHTVDTRHDAPRHQRARVCAASSRHFSGGGSAWTQLTNIHACT
jgi:hypothetical protein